MLTNPKKGNQKTAPILISTIATVIFLLWIFVGGFLPKMITGKTPEGPGVLGDSFGMVNALFSGLALLGVIAAIWLQQREFQNQLHEFEEQTRLQQMHLDQQTEASKAQLETAREQIEMFREEREARIREREISLQPLFTFEITSMERMIARFRIHNGGGPVFNLRIFDRMAHFYQNSNAGATTLTSQILPSIVQGEPANIQVKQEGLNSPVHGGSFEIEMLRGDRVSETYRFLWSPVHGLSKEEFPPTEVVKVE